MSTHYLYHNIAVPNDTHPVVRELYFISKGGRWKKTDKTMAGNGLFFHYKEVIREIWPEVAQHRWFDDFLKAWLNHTYIAVMGGKNTGKSLCATVCHLVAYYAHPRDTSILICSTTRERLEDRIWGEIKKFHKLAKQRFPFLSGNLIEGKQRLVTDDSSEGSEGRDFRNGVIAVPCFSTGTLVDTPQGQRSIESLRIGDFVFNAQGVGRITATHSRRTKRLMRVTLSDGRTIDCTPEHPFFTQKGWVNAVDLETLDMVFSSHETMCLLRGRTRPWLSQSKILLDSVPGLPASSSLRPMRGVVSSNESPEGLEEQSLDWEVLQPHLRESLVRQAAPEGCDGALWSLRKDYGCRPLPADLLLCSVSQQAGNDAVPAMRQSVRFDSVFSEERSDSFLRAILQAESDWPSEFQKKRMPYGRGTCCLEAVSRFDSALPSSHGREMQGWELALVSARHRFPRYKAGCGNRRWDSQRPRQGAKGSNSNSDFGATWVDRVEVLESSSDPRFEQGAGGYLVHNIEVDGHPSYSVNGVVVHNCKKGDKFVGISDFQGIKNKHIFLCGDELAALPKTFIDAISTLDIQGQKKVTGMGNPAQTTDALGMLAEPDVSVGGWDGGIDQGPKTKTWKTRWDNGVCLQYVGSDCPNMDVPEGEPVPYPFLMSREVMAADLKMWGKDDWHYTMFNEGRMPRGQGSRRVITRQLCLKHGAMEPPVWLNTNLRYITSLDAAYRAVGGDRCVLMRLAYGPESASTDAPGVMEPFVNQDASSPRQRTIIALLDTLIIPIKASDFESPEDQIVMFVKRKHEDWGLGPDSFFFDAGMRTSLVTAFARLWSNKVNSIDCGGKPYDRNVSSEINIPCKDYYDRLITQFWWASRLVIESSQARGFTDEVVNEGCLREWKNVGANKIAVETKDEMKLKCGRSPDLYDCLCIGLEGAQQRGFVVRKLVSADAPVQDHKWKRDLLRKAAEMRRSHELIEC